EAIACLGVWHKPSVLDRVDGRLRGPVSRDPAPVKQVMEPLIAGLLADKNPEVVVSAIDAVARLNLGSAGKNLHQMLAGSKNEEIQIAALKGLSRMADPEVGKAIQQALKDRKESVRAVALDLVPELSVPDAAKIELLTSVIGKNSVAEQQNAIKAIGSMKAEVAEPALAGIFTRWENGELNPGVQLELFEAAEGIGSESLKGRIEASRAKQSDELLKNYGEALAGGDIRGGRMILFRNQAAQCARCHAFGPYGGDVGPNLSEVGLRLDRRQLLESMINPSAQIAPGFGIVSFTLKDGKEIAGIVASENATEVIFKEPVNGVEKILKSNIEKRQNALSSMPPMGNIMTKRELRDMVEFLSSLKGENPGVNQSH
ncbi:MAG: HEAT repeat domain-containing protein, partial [Bacteroidetes bacterium]|nr:HEAT repeat domain-containing protein [Bacteroidota bacterium]